MTTTIIHAVTTRADGEKFCFPICVCSETEAGRILDFLNGRRTQWELHGQSGPSVYLALRDHVGGDYACRINREFERKLAKMRGVGRKTVEKFWDENNEQQTTKG